MAINMNGFWFTILILSLYSSTSLSLIIHCEYEQEDFDPIGEFYSCTIEDLIFISIENTSVSFTGKHYNSSFSDGDVKAFKTDFHRMIFFPQSIQETFKNLEVIYLNDGFLTKITQRDLQPFPKLKLLDLFENRLEIIEENLFKYNLELKSIWLSNNRIFEIHPDVFDHLLHLRYLHLTGNGCVARTARDGNRTEVLDLIREAKEGCAPGKVITTTTSSSRFKLFNITESEMKLFQTEHELKEFEEEYSSILSVNSELIKEFESYEEKVRELKKTRSKLTFVVFFLSVVVSIMAIVIFVGYRRYRGYGIGIGARVSMNRLIE